MPLVPFVRRRHLAVPALLCLTVAACGGGGDLRVIQHVKSVEINPATDTVDVGTTRTLQARVVPDNPNAEAPPNLSSVTWTSSDTTRLTISPAGSAVTVSGKAAGPVTLMARSVADPNVSATAQIVVTPRPAISIAVSPAAVSAVGGQTGGADVTLTRVGRVTSPVDVTVEDVPNGVTATATPATLSGGVTAARVTLAVATGAAPGDFALTLRGKTQGVSDATAPLTLRVPGFSLALPTSTISVARGLSGGSTARVAGLGGFASPVGLSLDPAPAGITGTLSAATGAAGDTVRITVRVDPTVAAGTYPLTLRGRANGFADQLARLTVTVPTPVPTGLIIVAGDKQTALGRAPLPVQPAVRVVDANGVPVPNVTVNFRVTGGAGSVTNSTDVSDATGIAQTTWTLGPGGANTLVASVPSLAAVPAVTFTATALNSGLASLAVGDGFTCGINAQHHAVCWGDNTYGQLGDNTRASRSTPAVVGSNAQFSQLAAGASHVCGLVTNNSASQVYCWGRNVAGALGLGDTQDRALPTPIQGTTLARLSAIAAGTDFTCGITVATGQAYCWGANADGQLGNGGTGSSTRPVTVVGGATFTTIAAGAAHTCGTTTGGTTLCWGRNADGQLGDGSTTSQSRPTLVKGAQSFVLLSLGVAHSCALTNAGQAFCWGNNASGQLGDGTTTQQLVPTAVATNLTFSYIGTHTAHTCAVTSTSSAVCWGANTDGQLGDGTNSPHGTPGAVSGGLLFITVDVGAAHSCGIVAGGVGYCWGKNASGQLGDTTNNSHNVPMPITLGLVGIRAPDR